MFNIREVEIQGFWGEKTLRVTLNDDVNIIIGDNGSGKTTFMEILQAVLTVDLDWLYENDFTEVKITLVDGIRKRTILVSKSDARSGAISKIRYKVSKKLYNEINLTPDVGRYSPVARRRVQESSEPLRNEILSMLKLSSLSVYRADIDYEDNYRFSPRKKWASAVDERLDGLINKLNEYQLSLSSQARKLSSQLQRDVLLSLLGTKKRDRNLSKLIDGFDEESELQRLLSAYRSLGINDEAAERKIKEYVKAMGERVFKLKQLKLGSNNKSRDILRDVFAGEVFDSFQSASDIAERSVEYEDKINEVFSHSRKFLEILNRFVKGKSFEFSDAGFRLTGDAWPLKKLSSGEKQLLIILSEAMLQKSEKMVFIADEPEISLHISWQRKIIKSVMDLNCNAQIIVATHSPEIAAGFDEKIIDMEDMFRV